MLWYTLNVSDDFFVSNVSLNAEKEAQDDNVGFFALSLPSYHVWITTFLKSLGLPHTICQRYHPCSFITGAMKHPRIIFFNPCIEIYKAILDGLEKKFLEYF